MELEICPFVMPGSVKLVLTVPIKLPWFVSPVNEPITIELVMIGLLTPCLEIVPVPGPTVPFQLPLHGLADCAEIHLGNVKKVTANRRKITPTGFRVKAIIIGFSKHCSTSTILNVFGTT